MYKAALAGAVLAAMGTTCTFAQNYETASYEQTGESGHTSGAKVVTAGHIARLKATAATASRGASPRRRSMPTHCAGLFQPPVR
jgi:hypothetical protein